MSWSFQAVGKPDAVMASIRTVNNGLTGQSLAEWEEAKPALLALVGANVGHVAVTVNASGHATFSNGEKLSGTCSCVIQPLYGFVE